ncbi:MAG: hypothetical protein LWW97_11225 [Deltaproteobacteria bacterium]|nr:hypothetical protein [Deltaproteobacteria bacterium]
MNDIIFVDIEASGLHFDSYPIEIALRINHKTHSWLIKPEHNWHYWSSEAEALHRISLRYLVENGLSALRVATEINFLLNETTEIIYSDAAEWDWDWMKVLFDSVKISPCFIVLSVQDLMDEMQQEAFTKSFKELANSGDFKVHRAGDDVKMIEKAYQFACNKSQKT